MKIQIRKRSPASQTGPVKVREKIGYSCKQCQNKYYSYHFFCPQCLGEVVSGVSRHAAILQIVSCPPELDSGIELLKKLSENPEFDFEKALQPLPWIFIANTDPSILQHWKECLEAQKIHAEILPGPPESKKRRRKPHPPVYQSDAPFPHLLPSSLTQSIRKASLSIPQASIKLQWAETVLLSLAILEELYKNPTGTILFYDFIFRIEEQIRDFVESSKGLRWSEAEFLKRNASLKLSFEQMATEIGEVRVQVQDQL